MRVVIAGGGVAGLEAMVALRSLAAERIELELLAPEPEFSYRPLAVAEPFGLGEAYRFGLAELAAGCAARFRLDALSEVDWPARRIRTRAGDRLGYDAFLLAVGAKPREAIPGALIFDGRDGGAAFRRLLEELDSGSVRRVVFAVPGGATWTLPLYELALLTAARAPRAEVALVTPEDAPLALFGREASEAVRAQLAAQGVTLLTERYPAGLLDDGRLALVPGEPLPADRVVSLPRLAGPGVVGLPQDGAGFVPTDPFGRIEGVEDVYAAGDATTFPVKQGGLAAQQADAVAETIAAAAGAPVEPRPFEAILRGLLLTGGAPAYLRAELRRGLGTPVVVTTDPLWWPAGKVAGRYLGPYLAQHTAPS